MTSDQKRLLRFYNEIDQMKTILRRIHIDQNTRPEDDAQHSWHTAMLVWLFASSFGKKLNLEKCLKLALMHDLVEIYAGDTFSYDLEARKTKAKHENHAAKKLFAILPKNLEQEFQNLWQEHEALKTNESKFVQAMDKLQPMLQQLINQGYDWKKDNVTEAMIRDRKSHHYQTDPFLKNLFETVLKQSRKKNYFPK